jgi:hypothetical protein
MPRNPPQRPRRRSGDLPRHPIVSETFHRDTLDRVAQVIALLEQLDLSDGLTPSARTGLYWIHAMLGDAVKHVSDALGEASGQGKR